MSSSHRPHPGFRIERRQLLWLPLGIWAACHRGLSTTAAHEPEQLAFAAFLDAWLPLAEQLIGDPTRIDAYLARLSELAQRAEIPDVPLVPSAKLGPGVSFGALHGALPLVATRWQLAPGAGIGPHNHPPFAGVTLALEGECVIRRYDLPEDAPRPPSGDAFALRWIGDDVGTPGRAVSPISRRWNVHELLPTRRGARGVDLYAKVDDTRHFSMLVIDDPRDGTAERRARWAPSG